MPHPMVRVKLSNVTSLKDQRVESLDKRVVNEA